MKIERQLESILQHFKQALVAEDWDKLAALDTKLQQALPKLKQAPLASEVKAKLAEINQFYSLMIARGESEKSEIRAQIQQQQTNTEGMQAYLQNR
ncbi:hypothetical protein [Photobacterium sanguinicancri]|uniref:Flagellar protein FliT n=1 Tax=Photobacterium sanguinicancri TaxID=875932 RepID=A0AAW7Y734_9GAMM|nr:hypothetical protein [Photobacterium sanguinicancri]KXI22984.1 hypothetical protein AS132_10685 [Photobacterium sanguinicancri]MDO6500193.1 hypothetical protein [Photobacterium sanguinicancri]MDO6543845.1 hypothetical protein [Photobacterium sanguinicancri]OZS44533.1 hypothetical protein ASV53_07575 [Photobacterium sanguinicancri]